jgi:hypothetical protein
MGFCRLVAVWLYLFHHCESFASSAKLATNRRQVYVSLSLAFPDQTDSLIERSVHPDDFWAEKAVAMAVSPEYESVIDEKCRNDKDVKGVARVHILAI